MAKVLFINPMVREEDEPRHVPSGIALLAAISIDKGHLVRYAFDKYGLDFIGFLDENLMAMDQYLQRTWLKEICRLRLEADLQPTCLRDAVPHDERCEKARITSNPQSLTLNATSYQ
jgi:hypothetical protein